MQLIVCFSIFGVRCSEFVELPVQSTFFIFIMYSICNYFRIENYNSIEIAVIFFEQ
jgi:hypothetical protein